jgi:SAM-dependent methyltransferase
MGFPLLTCSRLVKTDSDIWSTGSEDHFDYSDGDTSEQYLRDVMIEVQDLSSHSMELEQKVVDWVSEYHLSSQRANLLRGLSFEGVRNALELGCGCGAITRYLGELGINVDAVEGNLRRAEITRLRCRDLENVTITNANFNDLAFPKGAYDAIFLIGVLEYAKRFLPTAKDYKDAVIHIMSLAKSALKREGLLCIAIENRMGLKYWMGASEDHYGEPHVGLYGYPQDKGIRTFDKKEWEDILDRAGMKCCRFCYPFPDYKLPRVMLSDHYVRNDTFAHSILYRIHSRDYEKDWKPDVDEFLLWESLHQSGYLEYFANSFFMVISESEELLNNVIPYDFVYFSDSVRKPLYRTITIKPRDKDYVVKKKMTDIEMEKGDGFVTQNLSGGKYIKGSLLSSIWLRSLVGSSDMVVFEGLVKEYYRFLFEYFTTREDPNDTFDLLPFNIILDDTGLYRVIDKEWIINSEMPAEYVLFRALLWFSWNNKTLRNSIYKKKDITNIIEFIEYVFSLFSFPLRQELDQFIEFEERVQREVVFKKRPNSVRSMLMEPF